MPEDRVDSKSSEGILAVPVIIRGHGVAVGRVGRESIQLRVVREDCLPVDPIGIGALNGVNDDGGVAGVLHNHPGCDRLCGRGPGHEHRSRRIVTPGQVDLLGRPVGGRRSASFARERQGRRRGGNAGYARSLEEFTSRYGAMLRMPRFVGIHFC